MGMNFVIMKNGLSFTQSILVYHHHLFPLILGIFTGYLGYHIGRMNRGREIEVNQILDENARYRDLFENNLDSICILDTEGHFNYLNRATEILTGYSETELLKLNVSALIHPEDRKQSIYYIKKLRKSGNQKNFAGRIVRKNGKVRYVEVDANLVQQEKNNIGIQVTARDVTTRMMSDALLIESEKKFRTLTENLKIGIFRATKQGDFIEINPFFEDMFGYERDDFFQIKTHHLYHRPSDRKRIVEKLEKNGLVRNEHLDLIRKDGSVFTGTLTINEIKDKRGKTLFYDGIIDDITGRLETEKKLQETVNTLIKTQEVAEIGYFIYDIETDDWSITNDQLLDNILGINKRYPKNAKGWLELVYDEDRSIMDQYLLQEVIREGNHFKKEYRIRRKSDSQIRWVLGKGKLIKNDIGLPVRLIGAIRDITSRKESEIALKEAKERLKQVTEQSPSIFELYDEKGLLIDVNKAYEDFWHFPEGRARTIGKLNLLSDETVQKTGLLDYIKKAYRGEIVTLPPYQITVSKNERTSDDMPQRWLSTKIYPLKNSIGAVTNIVINHEDITEKVKTEKENRLLQEQVLHSQKMESIGTLAGGIAHDFNNILGIIMGFSELSLSFLNQQDKLESNLKKIISASERAKEMVQQILDFSRKSDLQMEELNLPLIISETRTFLRSSIPTSINLISDIENNLGPILGNATQINQVLMNLCTNASHAMEKTGSGSIKIALKAETVSPAENEDLNLQVGEYQKLTISDSGCGIDPEVMDRIFEPYFTTKPKDKGTGMGLAVVYGIVMSHGGKITVKSQLGIGTTFEIYLPALKQRRKTEAVLCETIDIIGNNEHILFVDDEAELSEIGGQMLEKLGYDPETSSNSTEALAKFRSSPESYDLIVTDMNMPNMNGIKLTREIHKIRPSIPVIICSGFNDSLKRTTIAEHGFSELVAKPFTEKTLGQSIKSVLLQLEQKQLDNGSNPEKITYLD